MNPFQVVKDFEAALCEYTGAPYCVTTTSCTMALLLAVAWHIRLESHVEGAMHYPPEWDDRQTIEIPKRTYIGVPMSIIHAGGRVTFRDEEWIGAYTLRPLPVWDSARWFMAHLFPHLQQHHPRRGLVPQMVCVSFHWNKTLGLGQGGAILHDDPEADKWLRKSRFDGRTEGVAPKDDIFDVLGWHCYMSPETAAQGLVRLANLPRRNEPLPNDDYPDLSQLEIFK